MPASLDPALRVAIAESLALVTGIRAAFVFGSRSTDHHREESDLDLALAFDPKTSELERVSIKLDLIDAITRRIGRLGEKLDLTDLDAANSAVAFRAVRDGVAVYERSKEDRVQVVARVCARAADDEYYRTRAAQMAKARLLRER